MSTGNESTSSMDETGKRRRQYEEKDEEAFTKSKKVTRSPLKTHKSSEDKLDKILNMMVEVKTEISEIRRVQNEYQEEIMQIRKENEKLRNDYETTRKENEGIKQELSILKNSLDRLGKDKKEKNIVITGLIINDTEPKAIQDKINWAMDKHLQVKVQVKAVSRLGQKAYLVQLNDLQDKDNIMKNKHKLRNVKDERIYINDDLTKMDRDMQKQIRLKTQEERKEGKTVKIGFSKLTTDGEVWKWNKLTSKLEQSKN